MRRHATTWCIAVAVMAAMVVNVTGQTSITLNPSSEYQTIEGLGGFCCMNTAKLKQGPFYVDAPMEPYYDSLAYDLGISLVRFEVSPDFWPSESSAYDPDAGVFCGPVSYNIQLMQELGARGVNRFAWTVWSPPGWMKYSGETSGPAEGAPSYSSTQSKLIPSHYDEFGIFLRDYLAHMRDGSGVTPYALSIANEPRFTQPFNNCVWDPASYRDGLKVVGPIVKAEFPNLRFFGTEAMFWEVNNWLNTILSDNTASQYLDAVAGHYGSSSDYSSTWSQASGYGKALWGSEEETDEDESGISAAMSQANRLHYALAGGSCSGWIGWTISQFNSGESDSRVPHWIYYGAKHFFRFVRPDAIRIGVSGAGGLRVSAYKHVAHGTYTVVIVNSGGGANITLQGAGIPSTFHKYQTDASHQCEDMGTVQASSSISVPGNGIVTLYSGDITSVLHGQIDRSRSSGVRPVRSVRTSRVYTLDGRLAVPGSSVRSTGVNLIVDAKGVRRAVDMSGVTR